MMKVPEIPQVYHQIAYQEREDGLRFYREGDRFTLSGRSAQTAQQLLGRLDGGTPSTELIEGFEDEDEARGVLGFLHDHNIIYDAAHLDVPDARSAVLENVLIDFASAEHEEVLAGLGDTAVSVFGDDDLGERLRGRLEDLSVGTGAEDPDITVFVGTGDDDPALEEANQHWLRQGNVVMRAVYSPERMELGPILSHDAAGCLHCVQQRLESNDQLSEPYTYPRPEGPFQDLFMDKLEELVLRTLLQDVPVYMVERVLSVRRQTMQTSVSDVMAVPGCRYCDR